MIVLAGTIGAGKSSLTDLIAEKLNSPAYYESIEDNKVLPLFYANPKNMLFYCKFIF